MIAVAAAFVFAAVIAITTIPDEALITINSLEVLGIIYLAVATSKLRERIAALEGKHEQHERELDRSSS